MQQLAKINDSEQVWVGVFVAMNIFDAATTYLALSEGFIEGDWMMGALILKLGLWDALMLKVLAVNMIALLFLKIHRGLWLRWPAIMFGLCTMSNLLLRSLFDVAA